MAVLAPPFILCPLADSKEFLGITGDQQDNKIILTIGKHIAIRYHVPEQKQEVSWASSRHWLTSRVVFCPDLQKYGAVIDNSTVGIWDENDGYLAVLKKYKYSDFIFELRATKTLGTLVIFKNGQVFPLSQPHTQNKYSSEVRVEEDTEKIINVEVDEKSKQLFLLCGNIPTQRLSSKCGVGKLRKMKVITLKVECGLPDLSSLEANHVNTSTEVMHTVEVSTEGDMILGTCVVPNGEDSFVVYLCADGFLYRRWLIPSSSSEKATNRKNDDPEGFRITNMSKCVSTTNPVVIKALDPSTLVIYGSDASEEGAVVFIYDITYDLMLSKQSLKLYSFPPIMEKVGLNIFVPVGLHILVLALRITKSLLSSVLGRHQLRSVDFFETRDPWVKAWGKEDDGCEADIEDEMLEEGAGFQDLVKLVKTLENHGQPQSVICTQVIPQIVENRNFAALNWVLDYFSDIPESVLIRILPLLLGSIEKTEIRSSVTTSDDLEKEVSTLSTSYPSHRQINQILRRPFEQRQMIRSFRTMDFEIVKKFLEYLYNRLDTSWDFDLDENEEYGSHVSNLIKWICTVFDAHYPQFVFHNEIEIVERLIRLMDEKSKLMSEIEGLAPLLLSTISKVSFQPSPSPNSKFRTETILFE